MRQEKRGSKGKRGRGREGQEESVRQGKRGSKGGTGREKVLVRVCTFVLISSLYYRLVLSLIYLVNISCLVN